MSDQDFLKMSDEERRKWEGLAGAGKVVLIFDLEKPRHIKFVNLADSHVDFDGIMYSPGEFRICLKAVD